MSINPREIDSYIEHRRSSNSKYDVPVQKKVSKPVKKDIFNDSDDPSGIGGFLSGIFGSKRNDEYFEDSGDSSIASDSEKQDFSGKDKVDVKFDSNGNIIGKKLDFPVKSMDGSEPIQKRGSKGLKGLFSGFLGLFSRFSGNPEHDEPDEDDFVAARSSGQDNDMKAVISSIDSILGRLSPAGLETIKKSKDYTVIDSMKKKYK